ncbi:MAG: alpha-ketoglutarate transporter, partial [Methylocystis sp.]
MKLLNAPEPKELSPRAALAAGASGNRIEWYDFYVYAAFSLYFADSFFPNADPLAQMLSTSGIFALGFFMRPIGALIFGRIGDRVG